MPKKSEAEVLEHYAGTLSGMATILDALGHADESKAADELAERLKAIAAEGKAQVQ